MNIYIRGSPVPTKSNKIGSQRIYMNPQYPMKKIQQEISIVFAGNKLNVKKAGQQRETNCCKLGKKIGEPETAVMYCSNNTQAFYWKHL